MLRKTLVRLSHENPFGLPKKKPAPLTKRAIPHVKHTIVVASGKGGVGKSSIATNIALSLSRLPSSPRVGLLDLDIFGPSTPKLLGLDKEGMEAELTDYGALKPLSNHGISSMSIGYLLPNGPKAQDTPVVWRGMMVQKATQQLLFDTDWRGVNERQLDYLIIDMPPGTGDVPLTVGQLVQSSGAVIVTSPQDIALLDTRKGMATFTKLNIKILGMMLNMSHFLCENCSHPHEIFGDVKNYDRALKELSVDDLGRLPLAKEVSSGGDSGLPLMAMSDKVSLSNGASEARKIFTQTAQALFSKLPV
ncbi:P-loop containing nucleoside triphosphate hydrolase protein [Wallemia mellicola]|uniref:P-loop containing nucleoside triphosphate hydrolase protein n=1 Tax=Wallemia mellicola TaxID=1708541 RepID=A0A4T0NPL3_9BASI|nr:P-loop containing nucleoside triphosphate hydrolase protein [Wallemia mellicola]